MTRRDLLLAGIAVPAAALGATRETWRRQGLDKFGAGGPPSCDSSRKLTPAADDKQFRPGSPERTAIAGPGSPGKVLHLSGAVIGIRCGAIKDAVVDVWQADATGSFDATGFRLRGHQKTDVNGRYHFESIVPGIGAGHARHVSLRAQPNGKSALTTMLFFPGDPSNANDPSVKPELVMKTTTEKDALVATIDIVLDL